MNIKISPMPTNTPIALANSTIGSFSTAVFVSVSIMFDESGCSVVLIYDVGTDTLDDKAEVSSVLVYDIVSDSVSCTAWELYVGR